MMDRITLKEYAKRKVNGKRLIIWKGLLYVIAGSLIVSLFTPSKAIDIDDLQYTGELLNYSKWTLISSLITALLLNPLNYGFNQYMMDFDHDESGNTGVLFSLYKYIVKIFVLSMFITIVSQSVTILGWLIMVLSPSIDSFNHIDTISYMLVGIGQFIGIYLSFCFAAVPFIFNENKELSIIEIMQLSNAMMRGHKMEYFILEFSFIGWYLLGAFTCGILYIWIFPYSYFTTAKYFLDLKNEYYRINGGNHDRYAFSSDKETISDEEDRFTIG